MTLISIVPLQSLMENGWMDITYSKVFGLVKKKPQKTT